MLRVLLIKLMNTMLWPWVLPYQWERGGPWLLMTFFHTESKESDLAFPWDSRVWPPVCIHMVSIEFSQKEALGKAFTCMHEGHHSERYDETLRVTDHMEISHCVRGHCCEQTMIPFTEERNYGQSHFLPLLVNCSPTRESMQRIIHGVGGNLRKISGLVT